LAGLLTVIFGLAFPSLVAAQGLVSCAVPESMLGEAYITVNPDQPQVNVRSGPNSYLYGKVGILLAAQSAPALGRSPGGEWIQIACPAAPGGVGWVYAANVTLTAPGDLPVVDIPATATPMATPTVDPALAAQFPPPSPTSTRLPTFTPAAPPLPLAFDNPSSSNSSSGPGMALVGVAGAGILLFVLSLFLRR